MTRRLGIDTSVLVRLVTGDRSDTYEHCVQELTKLVEQGDEVFASNQVIGEAYIAIQHHYGIDKDSVRAGPGQCPKKRLSVAPKRACNHRPA